MREAKRQSTWRLWSFSRKAHGMSETPHVVKPQTIREFERSLLTLGFSKREARAIASNGFKATQPTDELAQQLDEVAHAVARLQSILKV